MEVTALEAFTSPTAFKKELKYLVKISLDDDKLVVCKMLSNKSGTSVQPAILNVVLALKEANPHFFFWIKYHTLQHNEDHRISIFFSSIW